MLKVWEDVSDDSVNYNILGCGRWPSIDDGRREVRVEFHEQSMVHSQRNSPVTAFIVRAISKISYMYEHWKG